MLIITAQKHLLPFVGSLLVVLIFLTLRLNRRLPFLSDNSRWIIDSAAFSTDTGIHQDSEPVASHESGSGAIGAAIISTTHREIFSLSTADKRYFSIKFGNQEALNPNIIPHPVLEDTWIIVAQWRRPTAPTIQNSFWSAELVCNAVFTEDDGDGSTTLGCVDPPIILPIAATTTTSSGDRDGDGGGDDKCIGDLAPLTFNIGPHDARVFYGPDNPYAIYGSNSAYTCFGQWMLDFRALVGGEDWGLESFTTNANYRTATELQRPRGDGSGSSYMPVEKNWFVFWDISGQEMYAHYDVFPKRVFARLGNDGSVIGPDLASLAAALGDEACMARYMPRIAAAELESIHQATNSLSVTLCARSDPSCDANDPANTFILVIFQHKSFYSFHSVYEPYVMLFRQTSPFQIYGIARKPIWIHGRKQGLEGTSPDQTEMFYITSISWKSHGQKYHGYIDDVLFLAFGIEDSKTAGIDVVAGDLLNDLGLCSSAE